MCSYLHCVGCMTVTSRKVSVSNIFLYGQILCFLRSFAPEKHSEQMGWSIEWMQSLEGYKLFTEMFNDLDRTIDGCFDDGAL